MYIITENKVGTLATGFRPQGPKNDKNFIKNTQKCQNWLEIKGKNDASSEILVAGIFRIIPDMIYIKGVPKFLPD